MARAAQFERMAGRGEGAADLSSWAVEVDLDSLSRILVVEEQQHCDHLNRRIRQHANQRSQEHDHTMKNVCLR
eukprot:2969476-Rhodomonas_salina.2